MIKLFQQSCWNMILEQDRNLIIHFLWVKNMGKYHVTPSFGGQRGLTFRRISNSTFINPLSFCHTPLTFNHHPARMCFPDTLLVLWRILLKQCSWRKSYHYVYCGLLQNQSILLQMGSRCCFAILILISIYSLAHFPDQVLQVSLLTHLIHYLSFPFSPDNNHPTSLRISKLTSCAFSFFLISTLKHQTFIEYQSCARHHVWAMVCQK